MSLLGPAALRSGLFVHVAITKPPQALTVSPGIARVCRACLRGLSSALLGFAPCISCRSVLCVAPHPDDNEIGMGGVIAQMTAAGVYVDYLTVTDGALGDLGLHDPELDLAHVRKTEAIAAGQLLGVRDFYWLDLPDGTLRDVPALARAIAERLRQGGYDAVFCPDPWNAYEAHMDHVVVGRATAQAAISCNLRAYPESTHTAPCNLQAVGFYFTGKPNTVVDITGYFAQKMQAIAAHQSQIS